LAHGGMARMNANTPTTEVISGLLHGPEYAARF
jgi:hypothetical protein